MGDAQGVEERVATEEIAQRARDGWGKEIAEEVREQQGETDRRRSFQRNHHVLRDRRQWAGIHLQQRDGDNEQWGEDAKHAHVDREAKIENNGEYRRHEERHGENEAPAADQHARARITADEGVGNSATGEQTNNPTNHGANAHQRRWRDGQALKLPIKEWDDEDERRAEDKEAQGLQDDDNA